MNEKQTSKPIPDFLFNEMSGINDAEDVLTKLFRVICFDKGIGPDAWMRLMERYLDKQGGKKKSVSERSTEKNNLKRQLESNNMTFKVFQRALRFIGDFETTFIVRLKDPVSGEITEHEIVLREAPSKVKERKLDLKKLDLSDDDDDSKLDAGITELDNWVEAKALIKLPNSEWSSVHTILNPCD